MFLSKKEKADSSKVLVYGTPEDIVKLRDYIDNTLPHLDLESDTIPLTAIQRHMLRSPKVHDQIFQDFYDEKVLYSLYWTLNSSYFITVVRRSTLLRTSARCSYLFKSYEVRLIVLITVLHLFLALIFKRSSN